MYTQDSVFSGKASQSLLNRRHLPSQASVRSTTRLRGNTSNPCPPGRLAISKLQPVSAATQPISFPAYPPSVQIKLSLGNLPASLPVTSLAPSLLSLPKGLDISRVYGNGQQQSHSVYDDMPLSSEDLLAGIAAPRPLFPRSRRSGCR